PFRVSDSRLKTLVDERVGGSALKYRVALARYLGERGLRDQALDEWTTIVAADGRDALARFALANALEASGQGDRALEEYRQAVALDGRSEFRARLAQRLWATHQYFQATAEWRAIREREPRNLEARLALARAYVRVGERADALREYRALLALDEAHAAARK